ncbi:hypothetical protein QTP88_028437 [Uroleucon formosanum]
MATDRYRVQTAHQRLLNQKNYMRIKEMSKRHAALSSAMMIFGKYSGTNPKSIKPKLIGKKHIGTQPTARGRRVTQIGVRHNSTSGRVPKWKKVNEHGYHQK